MRLLHKLPLFRLACAADEAEKATTESRAETRAEVHRKLDVAKREIAETQAILAATISH